MPHNPQTINDTNEGSQHCSAPNETENPSLDSKPQTLTNT